MFKRIKQALREIFNKEKKQISNNDNEKDKESYIKQADQLDNGKSRRENDDSSQSKINPIYCFGKGNLRDNKKTRRVAYIKLYNYETGKPYKFPIGNVPNTEAYLIALVYALVYADKWGYQNILILTHSKRVIYWLNGALLSIETNLKKEWNTNNEDIKKLITKIASLSKFFNTCRIYFVEKEQNLAISEVRHNKNTYNGKTSIWYH